MGCGVGDVVAVEVAVSVGSGVDVAAGNGVAVSVGGVVGSDVEVCVGVVKAVAAPSLSWASCGATSTANVEGSGVAVAVDARMDGCVTAASICGATSWATAMAADSVDGGRAVLDCVVRCESTGTTRFARPPHRKRSIIRPRPAPQPVRRRLNQRVCGVDRVCIS